MRWFPCPYLRELLLIFGKWAHRKSTVCLFTHRKARLRCVSCTSFPSIDILATKPAAFLTDVLQHKRCGFEVDQANEVFSTALPNVAAHCAVDITRGWERGKFRGLGRRSRGERLVAKGRWLEEERSPQISHSSRPRARVLLRSLRYALWPPS